ncbi:MAG: DF family (seleno)protein [Dehalococcoidia bacterium]
MKVEIFVSNGCSHRDRALEIVNAALSESGRAETPVAITVNDYEDAKVKRCFGSPTIRVNGMDVEYGDREPEEFTAGCRYYNTPDGWQPLPRKELVARGIETAARREQAAATSPSKSQ